MLQRVRESGGSSTMRSKTRAKTEECTRAIMSKTPFLVRISDPHPTPRTNLSSTCHQNHMSWIIMRGGLLQTTSRDKVGYRGSHLITPQFYIRKKAGHFGTEANNQGHDIRRNKKVVRMKERYFFSYYLKFNIVLSTFNHLLLTR